MIFTALRDAVAKQLGWKNRGSHRRKIAAYGRAVSAGVMVLAGGMAFVDQVQAQTVILTEDFEGADTDWSNGFGTYATGANFSDSPHSGVTAGGAIYAHMIGIGNPTTQTINIGAGTTDIDFDGWLAAYTVDPERTVFRAEFFDAIGGAGSSLGEVVLASGFDITAAGGVTENVDAAGVLVAGDTGATDRNWKHYVTNNPVPVGALSVLISYNSESALGVNGGNDAYTDNIEISVTGGGAAETGLNVLIDRDTGAIVLKNDNAFSLSVKGYSILSGVGALIEANYSPLADSDSNWIQFTAAGATGDLSEGHLTTGSIAGNSSVALDNGTDGAWFQYFDESDITFEYLNGTGDLIQGDVTFVGTTQATPFAEGDLNFDGDINGADWLAYVANLGNTFADQTDAQAYRDGDFDNNGANNHADFLAFKGLFEAANGPGSLAALAGGNVPEPSSLILLACASFGLIGYRVRQSH